MNRKIMFWSPMSSHVGTINAVIKSANSLISEKNEIYIINVIGEFNHIKHEENQKITFLKVFNIINFLPSTGVLSKFFIYIFSIFAIPKLVFFFIKYKPDYIFSYLLSIIPLFICKFFFKDIKIICSIQGYPKLNFLRLKLWKIFYSKANFIITMTNITKNLILEKIQYDKKRIMKVNNPIIDRNIKKLSSEALLEKEEKIFNKKVIISVGRLTRQKNFILLLKAFNDEKIIKNYNLIIVGEGENRKIMEDFIVDNNLNENVFLLGYVKNPFRLIAKANIYISTSAWEEPGHSILEAGYLNLPIITSDCPNGPKELYFNKFNSFVFKNNDINDLKKKIAEYESLNEKTIKNIKVEMKKLTKNFTKINFRKNICKIFNFSL